MNRAERLVALQRSLYDSRNATRRYLHCTRRDWVLGQIAATNEQCNPQIALEVGPGSGVYLPALAAICPVTIALDSEEAYLVAARDLIDDSHAGKRSCFVRADMRMSPISPGSVDLVLCSEVLEHVEDSSQMLASMAELLSPQGRLILTTPQPASPLELLGRIAFLPGMLQLLRLIYREPVEPTGHINVMRRTRLEAQVHAANLRILRRDTCGLYLPVIAEFGGAPGQRLLAFLDGVLRRTPLRCLLWTQCYLLAVSESGPTAAHECAATGENAPRA